MAEGFLSDEFDGKFRLLIQFSREQLVEQLHGETS
jgi:hypothetical protein